MAGIDQAPSVNFRGNPRVEAKTGDIVFIANIGLRLIPCRVKRSLLKRLAANPVPCQEELLTVFATYRQQIELLVEQSVLKGEYSPVISDLDYNR
jgi:hypothetical protein